jgi:hypothetical protein
MTDEHSTVSWIDTTAQALVLAKDAKEAQRQTTGLEEIREDLATLLEDYRDLAASAEVVRPLGWGGKSPKPQLASDLRKAATATDTRPLNSSRIALREFKTDVKTALNEWWTQYAARRLGDVMELQVLAATLSGVEGVVDLSRRLETILGEVARTQAGIPSLRSAELLQEAETALADLEQSLKPESVRHFLSAVARGGASLDLVSPDVTEWLNAHHAQHSFKIIAGAPTAEAHV